MLAGAAEQQNLSTLQEFPYQVKVQGLAVAPPPPPPPPAQPRSSPDVAPEANADDDSTCTAVNERGTNKGVRCTSRRKPGTAFCGRHRNWGVGGLGGVRDRGAKRKEPDGDRDNNPEGEPDSGSQGQLQGGGDLEARGGHASPPAKWEVILEDISKIPEQAYKEAFGVTRMEPPTRTSREGSLTQATLDRLPKVDSAGYDAVTGSMQDLTFSFFTIMFPVEAVDLMVKYTNDDHDDGNKNDSFTNEDDSTGRDDEQQTQQPRHRSQFKGLGGDRVPSGGFRREHVYGSLGILLEMLITKLPRMYLHWGTGGKHNYPHVRRTMPRYFFFFLMARLFHLGPGESSQKGNASYDSAAHIREMGNKVQLAATNAHLAMKKWATLLLNEVQSDLNGTRPGDCGVDADGAVEGSDRTDAGRRGTNLKPWQLTEMERRLVKLLRVEKYKWDIHLSDSLEDKCRIDDVDDAHLLNPGQKQSRSPVHRARAEVQPKWLSTYLKNARVCSSRGCKTRTLGICACRECAGDEIIMCSTCAFDSRRHMLARQSLFSKRKDGRPRTRKKVRRHELEGGSNEDGVAGAPPDGVTGVPPHGVTGAPPHGVTGAPPDGVTGAPPDVVTGAPPLPVGFVQAMEGAST